MYVYLKCSIRRHPETGSITGYYRLVESYRNADDLICHRTILNVGYMEDTNIDQRNKIQKQLTDRYEHKEYGLKKQIRSSINMLKSYGSV